MQAIGSKLTNKSSKRKWEFKGQSNYDTSCKKKFPNEKGFKVTRAEDEEKGLEVTTAEDEEKLRESVVVGPIGDLHENIGSPTKVETITVSMPYIEYVYQNICSPYNIPVINGKGTYHSVLHALYVQKTLDWKCETLTTDLRDVLQISNEENDK